MHIVHLVMSGPTPHVCSWFAAFFGPLGFPRRHGQACLIRSLCFMCWFSRLLSGKNDQHMDQDENESWRHGFSAQRGQTSNMWLTGGCCKRLCRPFYPKRCGEHSWHKILDTKNIRSRMDFLFAGCPRKLISESAQIGGERSAAWIFSIRQTPHRPLANSSRGIVASVVARDPATEGEFPWQGWNRASHWVGNTVAEWEVGRPDVATLLLLTGLLRRAEVVCLHFGPRGTAVRPCGSRAWIRFAINHQMVHASAACGKAGIGVFGEWVAASINSRHVWGQGHCRSGQFSRLGMDIWAARIWKVDLLKRPLAFNRSMGNPEMCS